jgi:hypothetical protein
VKLKGPPQLKSAAYSGREPLLCGCTLVQVEVEPAGSLVLAQDTDDAVRDDIYHCEKGLGLEVPMRDV